MMHLVIRPFRTKRRTTPLSKLFIQKLKYFVVFKNKKIRRVGKVLYIILFFFFYLLTYPLWACADSCGHNIWRARFFFFFFFEENGLILKKSRNYKLGKFIIAIWNTPVTGYFLTEHILVHNNPKPIRIYFLFKEAKLLKGIKKLVNLCMLS